MGQAAWAGTCPSQWAAASQSVRGCGSGSARETGAPQLDVRYFVYKSCGDGWSECLNPLQTLPRPRSLLLSASSSSLPFVGGAHPAGTPLPVFRVGGLT